MSRYYERNDSGYTRGGLDVVTGINLFFKGILIFPILVLATFVGLTMVKFVLFQGLPTMSQPSEEQRQQINDRDREISQRPVVEDDTPEVSLPVSPYSPSGVNNGYPLPPVLPAPDSYSSVSNCKYSPVCPPGGENRVGANGLPYVWPTATPVWNTEIEEDPFN